MSYQLIYGFKVSGNVIPFHGLFTSQNGRRLHQCRACLHTHTHSFSGWWIAALFMHIATSFQSCNGQRKHDCLSWTMNLHEYRPPSRWRRLLHLWRPAVSSDFLWNSTLWYGIGIISSSPKFGIWERSNGHQSYSSNLSRTSVQLLGKYVTCTFIFASHNRMKIKLNKNISQWIQLKSLIALHGSIQLSFDSLSFISPAVLINH